jgi:3-methyl-2-oxobutanoate hydroxymethyltransferase
MVRRLSAASIRKRKGSPFPVITAYDAPFARFAEAAGIDVLLVGDSLGNVVLGLPSTVTVELNDMERHGAAVARGSERAHVIVDMPFGSYEPSDADAVRSAVRLVKHGATSVKLEGGRGAASRIAAIAGAGIPVVGHIGVTPQTAELGDGFRIRRAREAILADAHAVEEAGAFAIVLEMVDAEIAREVTGTLTIPTIGIGSGPWCDAQVLVLYDALGLYDDPPSFARKFADVATVATEGLRAYAQAVRSGSFPERPLVVTPSGGNGPAAAADGSR